MKFKLIQAFINDLVTCKNEEGPFKNDDVSDHSISPIISLWAANSAVPSLIMPNFEPI